MIHKGERPFECNFCKQKFREKSNYNYHMKKHISKDQNILNNVNNTNKKINNKNDLVIEKNINNFYIKKIKQNKKSMDNNSTLNNSDKNSISINDNKILEDKIINSDFSDNFEIISKYNNSEYNSINKNIIYDLKNFEKLGERDIYFNNIEKDKLELIDPIGENEFFNNSIFPNENVSFNENKELYDFYNYKQNNNKFLNKSAINNLNYYGEFYIKNKNNVNKFEILLPGIDLYRGKNNQDFEY